MYTKPYGLSNETLMNRLIFRPGRSSERTRDNILISSCLSQHPGLEFHRYPAGRSEADGFFVKY